MNVVDTLIERNVEFRAHRFTPGLPLLPRQRTLILGCVDPRVDPSHILGIPLGEAAVIRNIGGRFTPAVFGEVALLGRLTAIVGGPGLVRGDLIVLQHTDCGITRLQEPPEMLAGFFQIDPAALPDKHVADPYVAVHDDVTALRNIEPINAAFQITGVVYDVQTGRIDVVSSAEADR